MTDPTEQHNKALLPLLRTLCDYETDEARQWVIIESLCLGVGKLHGRTPRDTAEFVEAIAERLTNGART